MFLLIDQVLEAGRGRSGQGQCPAIVPFRYHAKVLRVRLLQSWFEMRPGS
ncbi:hypothetical protein [Mycobacteroides abscessus]|nr:hypothetical protein [Mycobacteroides abscessus]